ncbi:MAG: beta-ketoacyl-ACP synthase II [Chloroflexi bacterium]|nr:beta-ketoacyl-ACP synthase II [Chloroflexota bacterium]
MSRRVVVTGMGAISPVGNDVPTAWATVVAGISGIGPITKFNTEGYRSTIAGEIKGFDPKDHFPSRDVRRLDPFVQFAVVATREAVRDAQISFGGGVGGRTAVIIGSGIGGMTTITEQTIVLHERGPGRVSPFLIPMALPETASSVVAIEFGLTGPNMAVTSACATGANAIGEGFEMIRRGIADVAICGGTEAGVHPLAVAGFSAMRALSERNDEPERASRPFDRDRDGFVVSEGAGVMVLETLEHAQARGARIYAELAGYGSTDDAFHITAPEENGAGAVACMRQSLICAGLAAEQIDYINAHGTSTPLNDKTETRAIKTLFGERAYAIAVSATKSMTGHLLGGAGALEAIFTVKSLETGVIPPTINLDNPDPECDLDYVPHQARQAELHVALSNSFGFGGHNACLVFRRLNSSAGGPS